MLAYGKNQALISTGFLLRQFSGRPRVTSLLQAFSREWQAFDTVCSDLINKRTLASASGKQLDGIGDILGVSRNIAAEYAMYLGFTDQPGAGTFGQAPIRDMNQQAVQATGLDDTTYKTILYLQILLNTGHGTLAEIETALATYFSLKSCVVQVTGPAEITITAVATSATPVVLYTSFTRYIPFAAGVAVISSLTSG